MSTLRRRIAIIKKLGNLSIEDFRSSLIAKLPTQADVNNLSNSNSLNIRTFLQSIC